ncbi:MAG: hypothetical protein PHY43_08035 [Verrucomicrobiales bacterium]|nr:hypothetical protein [Verrucomicrobiales bacterium]
MPQPITWKQLVADALQNLGGEASLKDITAKLEKDPHRPETATWQATIRRVVRQYSIFQSVKTQQGLAGYRLVQMPKPNPSAQSKSDPHGEQQGMLLQLGALCGYETFTNSTDKTIRKFQGEPISSFATVRNDADDLLALPLEKMRNTDVMWMASDSEGLYPRYAFEIEHSTKVKSGLLRLLKIPERFPTKLFVIGPGDEEADLFSRYLRESPFRQHAHRFRFYHYKEVSDFYKSGINFDKHRKNWEIQFASAF